MANAHNQTVGRMSPRQKMINLMYIVLTAMLALNVSSDVLNGFTQVEDGLTRSNRTVSDRNRAIYDQLEAFNAQNPEKGGVWYARASEVRQRTGQLYNYIDSLKTAIVKTADGEDGDVRNIRNQDDTETPSVIMLAPRNGKGRELRERIDLYRAYAAGMHNDSVKKANIENALSTASREMRAVGKNKTWEESMFENMPVVASVTLLSKIQNDLLYAEGEVLGTLLNNIDASDLRVNQVDAFVIPESRIVMRGSSYTANIVLAAVDTTQRPRVFVNGTRLDNDRGLYQASTSRSGNFDYSGYIEVAHGDGTTSQHSFKSSYTAASASAISWGETSRAISASMTNGSLTRNGDVWAAHPDKVGTEAVVTVTATIDGRRQTVATTNFRVRKLPDPMPYIAYTDSKGNPERYRGGKPFAKSLLLQTDGIGAAIDDDMLNVAYRVLGFETVFFDSMGNAIPEVSDGDKFSDRQKSSFRRLARGKRFYISRVRAIGPDGIERTLAPIEVIVN